MALEMSKDKEEDYVKLVLKISTIKIIFIFSLTVCKANYPVRTTPRKTTVIMSSVKRTTQLSLADTNTAFQAFRLSSCFQLSSWETKTEASVVGCQEKLISMDNKMTGKLRCLKETEIQRF